MDARLLLFYFSCFAGLVIIVGGVFLLWKEKIYIDRESNQPTEFEFAGNKFTGRHPVLMLFAIGFAFFFYPLYKLNLEHLPIEQVEINGMVSADAYPVLVYAAGGHDSLTRDGEFHLPVPFFNKEQEYRVLLVVNGHIIDEARAERRHTADGKIVLKFRNVTVEPNPWMTAEVQQIPDKYK